MLLRPGELLVLFVIGAAGGLVGDAGHVQAGTTTYLDESSPYIWESAIWFPALVGLATASLGQLRLGLGRRGAGIDLRTAGAAIAAVIGIYAVTALVFDEPQTPATALVLVLALLVVAWLADGWPALACGLIAALVGPLAEIVIVELELSRYHGLADSLLGVPLWLPALYLAFGVVVARLAELLVARRTVQAAPASAETSAGSSSPR